MSAGILLRQRNAAFILTDAACYFDTGVTAMFQDKCDPIPELHCALLTFGPLNWSDIIVTGIRGRGFNSFDEMKANIEPLMRELFEANCDDVTTHASGNATQGMFVGWSKQRQAPDAFVILLYDTNNPPKHFRPGTAAARPPFKIEQIDALTHTPCPTAAELLEARVPFSLVAMTENDLEQLKPEIDLLHLLEVQRHMKPRQEYRIVGGYAHLTRVDRHGVTQRRIHEWPEDKVGELIKPLPIDWVSWRAERESRNNIASLAITATPSKRLRRRQKARR
jgi:hypothetical protein